MSSKINPDYVIYEAIKVLREAKTTSIESPLKLKIRIEAALKILEDYRDSTF